MIYTARQLEQLHKSNGHVTLPYNARLTPAAHDWIRARKLAIGYTDGEAPARQPMSASFAARPQDGVCTHGRDAARHTSRGAFLWWCDGPCGVAKAAILAHAREAHLLLPVEIGADPALTASAVKHVASEVKSQRIVGAIIAVEHGAAAIVMLNRCPSLRAVLGTCLPSVDHAIRRVGANVLVLQHPHRTLVEMRNMIRRFTDAQARTVPGDVERQLRELTSCG